MQNQINTKLILDFINNERIRKYYDMDPVPFVYYLHLVKNYKNSKNYKDLLKQASLSTDYTIQKIVYHFMMDDYLGMVYETIDLVIKNYEIINDVILSVILHYFDSNKLINNDLDILEKSLYPKELGDTLIISTYFKKYIFEEDINVKTVDFYFYSDYINTLASIAFSSKGIINHEINPFKVDSLYDSIFYLPPYKYTYLMLDYMKNMKSLGVSNASLEIKEIYRFIRMLNTNGRMVSLVQTGSLNKTKDVSYRKVLIEKGRINSIIELPRFKDLSTGLSLIYFSDNNQEISLINASKFAMNLRKGVDIDSEKILRALSGQIEGALGKVKIEEAASLNYDLTPHRFFELNSDSINGSVPLNTVVKQIFRGYQISSDMLDEYLTSDSKIKLVTLSDINDNEISVSNLQSLKDIDKKMVHYTLKENDLLITCKGKSIKTCVVNIPYKETYIGTGSLIIVRVDENKINPYFLKIYFDSKLGKKALQDIQTGNTVLSLNPTKLMEMLIPLPSIDVQYSIAESYKYKLKSIKEVKEIIDDMKEEMEKKFSDKFIELLN